MDTRAQLQQQLDALFAMAPGRIVLWHDAEQRYVALLPELTLPEDVVLLRDDDEGTFDVLRAVNDLEVDERALFYRTVPGAVRDGDWFADVEAYAVSFYPVEDAGESAGRDALGDDAVDAARIFDDDTLAMEAAIDLPRDEVAALVSPSFSFNSRLESDWYSIAEFAELCECGPGDREALARAAWNAGYDLYADCVVSRRFATQRDYYDSLFESPLVMQDDLSPALLGCRSFGQYVYQANYAGKIFDYDDSTWITLAGLAELDISQTDIDTFVREALACCEDDGTPYFTEPWLAQEASSIEFFNYEMSRLFYESVLVSQSDVLAHGKFAGVRLFAQRGQPVKGRDFIAALVRRELSVDVDELVDILAEDYGIKLPRGQLLSLARKARLYYSKDHDRLYKDHDQFILEVE